MGRRQARTEAGLAVAAAVAMVAGTVLYFAFTIEPVHTNPAAIPAAAAASAPSHATAIDEAKGLARALAVKDNLPGLSVAVAINGEIVWAEAFGYADADGAPVTPLTRFRLGALSKPLAATAAAILHDEGRLDLDAPVQRYVPAYPQKQWPLTTRQLLGDVAGVHRIRGDNNDAMPSAHCASVSDAVAMLATDQLLFEPGTQHRYSVWGWVLVSAAIEGAAREPFDRFMVRRVFEPLGLTRTVIAETQAIDDVTSYSPRSVLAAQLGVKKGATPPDYSCVAGGGAFLSTPADLVRFATATMKPGLLKAQTIAALQTPTRLSSGASTTYALGWTVGSVQLAGTPTRIVSHRGSPKGGSVSLLTFPDRGMAIAAAANVSNATGVDRFARRVAEAFVRGAKL